MFPGVFGAGRSGEVSSSTGDGKTCGWCSDGLIGGMALGERFCLQNSAGKVHSLKRPCSGVLLAMRREGHDFIRLTELSDDNGRLDELESSSKGLGTSPGSSIGEFPDSSSCIGGEISQ